MPSRALPSPSAAPSIFRRLVPLALGLGLAAAGVGPLSAAIPPVTLVGGDYYPYGLPYLGSPSVPISVAPTFADIDGDGDPDAFLLASSPRIRYCENTGTPTAPAFAAPVPFPFGLPDIGYSSLTFADLDADGDLDAIAATGGLHAVILRNVGTATAPAFVAPVSLGLDSGGGQELLAYSVNLADLNGDGDLDALVGNDSGHLVYCQNTGTPASAAFATPLSDPFGLSVPDHDAYPAIGDLDRDGDLDVLVGTYHGMFVEHPFSSFYFENVGTPTAPAFAAPTPSTGGDFYTRPDFVDIDGDGELDIFIGDSIAHLFVVYSTAKGWYFTVTPCRALDTRDGLALASGAETRLLVQGRCGVPPTARAVAVNVTVTEGSSGGYLQAYKAGTPLPSTSVVNFAAGATRANSAILELGTSNGCSDCKGQLSLVPFLDDGGAVEVIVDVVGYFE